MDYFGERYLRLQKERALTIGGYIILKQFTGVSIPKLEEYLGITEGGEEQGETPTLDEIKDQFREGGIKIK